MKTTSETKLWSQKLTERNAGSPISTLVQGPMLSKLSHTCQWDNGILIKVGAIYFSLTWLTWQIQTTCIWAGNTSLSVNHSLPQSWQVCMSNVTNSLQMSMMWASPQIVPLCHTLPTRPDHLSKTNNHK